MQHARLGKGKAKLEASPENAPLLRHMAPPTSARMNAHHASLVVGSGAGTTLVVGKNRFHAAPGGTRNYLDPVVLRAPRFSHAKTRSQATIGIANDPQPAPEQAPDESQDTETGTPEPGPVTMTVWFHELRSYSQDVVVDSHALSGLRPGNVYELEPLAKDARKLVFIVQKNNILDKAAVASPAGQAKKGFQISLTLLLQKPLGVVPRAAVQVRRVANVREVELDTVEVHLKDINFSRDLQWSLSLSMVGTCCYVDQRVLYLDNRIGTVKCLFRDGQKPFLGYIGPSTNIVFRSESAKLVFLVQLSREMWHFEENGEIMFHKLVNTLFPRIFKRWRQKKSHHSITIVLFSSVDLTQTSWTSFGGGERPAQCQDYYRVVVDQVNVFVWDKIMASLRLEFANFKRDVLLHLESQQYRIRGEPCPSVKGNLLEAINLSLSLVTDRFRNTDLRHSVNNIVLVTAGTGLFDVDYDLMVETSKKMFRLDCGLDIISLSQPPLHTVPLFRYRDAQGEVRHCVPKWCDVSFYEYTVGASSQWIPRCKIYELQMMGVMENEVNEIQIERLQFKDNIPITESMDLYDEGVFQEVSTKSPSIARNGFKKKKKLQMMFKDEQALLSLMGKKKPDLLAQLPASKTNVSTTNSSVLGTVTNASIANSALSTLYVLNKTTEEGKTQLGLPASRLMSSASTVRSVRSQTSLRSTTSKPPKLTNGGSALKNDLTRKETEYSLRQLRARKRDHDDHARKADKKVSVVESEEAERQRNNPYWQSVDNPSKPVQSNIQQCSRWAAVFPPRIKRRMFKWRSFTAPAALPVFTTLFPTVSELENEYTFQIYVVILNFENKLELRTTRELMREMVRLRLAMGFQICTGTKVLRFEADTKGGIAKSILKYFPSGECTGTKIYMSLNDEIHRIFCDYNGSVNVQLYRRVKKEHEKQIALGSRRPDERTVPLIRTRYADEYTPSRVKDKQKNPTDFNWNQFDQLLAGYEDAVTDISKDFHRMKFVVVPTDIPVNAYNINNENLSEEEIRLEGLQKLIANIEKGRYAPTEEPAARNKDEISPEIFFYTGNLYDFLNEEARFFDVKGTRPTNSLMISSDGLRFNRNIKLQSLAQQLQSEGGITLVDRTWHFKVHPHCFLGSELVTWVLKNFEDVDSRESATEYGQQLMDSGLFRHVNSSHGFLDGHYFYEFNDEFVDESHKHKQNSTSWFRKKSLPEDVKDSKEGANSGNNTPLTPLTPSTPSHARSGSDNDSSISAMETSVELRKVLSQNFQPDSDNSSFSDSQRAKRKKTFMISKLVKYNCDQFKKSFRPEVLDVHYDRVHNPEHCYHIRLQWLNTTTKFIDETIINWSRLCERFGLKLVETPWSELCRIPELNPFHSFVDLKLAINPFTDAEFRDLEILKTNKFFFHLHFLKVTDFLLDNRGTSFFLKDHIDVQYSWGRPSFKYAQFIHKTGAYIVELRDNGEFFLAPNNVHILRTNTLANSILEQSGNTSVLDSQKVMLTFRERCKDETFLRKVFREAASYLKDDFDAAYVLGM